MRVRHHPLSHLGEEPCRPRLEITSVCHRHAGTTAAFRATRSIPPVRATPTMRTMHRRSRTLTRGVIQFLRLPFPRRHQPVEPYRFDSASHRGGDPTQRSNRRRDPRSPGREHARLGKLAGSSAPSRDPFRIELGAGNDPHAPRRPVIPAVLDSIAVGIQRQPMHHSTVAPARTFNPIRSNSRHTVLSQVRT